MRKMLAWLLLGAVLMVVGPVANAQVCQDTTDGMKSKLCWEVNLLWSSRNGGPVEPVIRDEWKRLRIDQQCMNPALDGRGRVTAMRLAIAAAKAHDDDRSFRIARSTQLHNSEALRTIDAAGPSVIAEWLRGRQL